MHIARIIEYFPPHIGGMEGHGLNLSFKQGGEFPNLGHEVEVFIGYGDENWGGQKFFKIRKMPFQFLPRYSKLRRIWFNIWAYFAIARYHKEKPFDVVHIHGDFVEAYFGGKISKKLGIPAILTIHAGLNKRFLKPGNGKYFKKIKKIICVSREIADDLEKIGVPENKIVVISSGIYLELFENSRRDKESEIGNLRGKYSKPIIISVGVLRPVKGFRYLISAFQKIKEKFKDASLIVIGDGPDRSALEKQAKSTGGIHFLGRRGNDEIVEYLEASDIFILASVFSEKDREGTPTSIMEAMAAGLPVVATKVGGIPDLIRDGENGFLVEEKNSDELAEAVVKLISNPGIRERMKSKNLADIKQKDWLEIAKQVVSVYQDARHQ